MSSISSALARTTTDQVVFLVGRPPLTEFISFIESKAAPGVSVDRAALAQEWRAAHGHIQQLEQSDPLIPSASSDVPGDLVGLAGEVLRSALVQRTFALLPIEIAMVELDDMVVFQKQINLDYVGRLRGMLGESPTAAEIFHFALPLDRRYDVPIQAIRTAANAWTFASPSSDFRQLEPIVLDGANVPDLPLNGMPSAVVALSVGYGSNFLTGIRVNDRLILQNGSHRAYALRDAGHTHAPCLIQTVSAPEELEVVGVPELAQRADLYITGVRPPLLKDYFDPRLRMLVDVPRTARHVRVAFDYEVTDAPMS